MDLVRILQSMFLTTRGLAGWHLLILMFWVMRSRMMVQSDVNPLNLNISANPSGTQSPRRSSLIDHERAKHDGYDSGQMVGKEREFATPAFGGARAGRFCRSNQFAAFDSTVKRMTGVAKSRLPCRPRRCQTKLLPAPSRRKVAWSA